MPRLRTAPISCGAVLRSSPEIIARRLSSLLDDTDKIVGGFVDTGRAHDFDAERTDPLGEGLR